MQQSDGPGSTRGWETYWTGARAAGAYTAGGASHPVIARFWDDFLPGLLSADIPPRIIDIATGSGAVVERLSQLPGAKLEHVTCVDIAGAAIDSLLTRFPDITGIVADAKSLPLETAAYDLITSQFGVEYAGPAGIEEAMRLTAAGGSLLFLMHIRSGSIYRECRAALDAIRRTRRCDFVSRSLGMFEAGFAAVRGADRLAYDEAAKRLAPSVRELESIIADHGEQVANGTIARLYADVGQIHSRIQHYDPDEVLDWLRTMERELADYEQRMASMCESAADQSQFEDICESLREAGFEIVRGEALVPQDDPLPLAWVLHATRRDG